MVCPNIIACSAAVKTYIEYFRGSLAAGNLVVNHPQTQTEAAIKMLDVIESIETKRFADEENKTLLNKVDRPGHTTFMEWVNAEDDLEEDNFYLRPSILNYPSSILTPDLVASGVGIGVDTMNTNGIEIASLLNIIRGTTYYDEETNTEHQFGYEDDTVFGSI